MAAVAMLVSVVLCPLVQTRFRMELAAEILAYGAGFSQIHSRVVPIVVAVAVGAQAKSIEIVGKCQIIACRLGRRRQCAGLGHDSGSPVGLLSGSLNP